MRQTLRFEATASASEIQSALARARAPQLAFVFAHTLCVPLSEEQWAALRALAAAQGQDVVIVGGDEALRASAVAAGFIAATSLDAEEQGRTDGVSESLDAAGNPVRRMLQRITGVPSRGRITKRLTLVPDPSASDDDTQAQDLYDPWRNDPPDYVGQLVATTGAYHAVHDGEPGTFASRITRPLGDAERLEALREEHERYEDGIAGRIRATGGVSGFRFPLPYPRVVGERNDPDAL